MNVSHDPSSSRSPRGKPATLFALAGVFAALTVVFVTLPGWPGHWNIVIGIAGCAIAGALVGAGIALGRMRSAGSAD